MSTRCDQRKPEGLPACSASGSARVIDALRREIAAKNLSDAVQITTSASLGLCDRGPNLVVYPAGVWYSGVTPEDAAEIVREHFENGRPVGRLVNADALALKREITANRDRMAAGLRARDAAGAAPDDLMETIRGYQASRILLSAIELDAFTAVERSGSGATASAVAAGLEADPRATEALLNALVGLGMIAKDGDVFANTAMAKRYLVAGATDDARIAIRHNSSLWGTWSTLSAVVRTGRPTGIKPMQARDDDWTVPFIAAMHKNAALRAPMIVQAVGADGVKRLLDVGGGSGAYSIAFAHANPGLVAEVLDLGPVLSLTEKYVAEAGLSDRVRTRMGDLRTDDFGTGHDLVLVSAICHMLGPDENRVLFRRAASALSPGGRVVVQDHVMTPDKTAPRAGALFAINMLVGTENGSTYSEDEYRGWLADAGFDDVRRIRLAGPNDLMVGRRA
jgi:(2Fe-2S) ferredoxin/SAM-dependent methyltransferase